MSGQLEITNPDTIAPPKSTYSHVSSFSVTGPCRIISIAGQAGIDKSYELVALDLDAQVKAALENLRACLESVGAGPKDVIRVTHYIVGYDEKDRAWSRHFVDFFLGNPPPATLVPGEPSFSTLVFYTCKSFELIMLSLVHSV